jgi:hypothetical protein
MVLEGLEDHIKTVMAPQVKVVQEVAPIVRERVLQEQLEGVAVQVGMRAREQVLAMALSVSEGQSLSVAVLQRMELVYWVEMEAIMVIAVVAAVHMAQLHFQPYC